MNTVRLLGTELLEQSAQFSLDEALLKAQGLLTQVATDESLFPSVYLAMGDRSSTLTIDQLRQQWQVEEETVLSAVEVQQSNSTFAVILTPQGEPGAIAVGGEFFPLGRFR